MKIHFATSTNGSTLCVRAIKVRGYVDLLVTNNINRVTCLECQKRLTKRAPEARKSWRKKYRQIKKVLRSPRAGNAKVSPQKEK